MLDPSGGRNRIVAADKERMLLVDGGGVQFILHRRRLGRGRGWRLEVR